MHYLFLVIAICGEIVGTSALKASEGFTKVGPSLLAVLGYVVAFYFLSRVLQVVPIGVAYAIWSGLGIALLTVIGYFLFDQTLDFAAILGLGLIVAGVVVLQVFSSSAGH